MFLSPQLACVAASSSITARSVAMMLAATWRVVVESLALVVTEKDGRLSRRSRSGGRRGNSWLDISAALVAGINSGGPVQLVYGLIIISITCTAIAISLADLASAMPNVSGQYFWAEQVAPEKLAPFASYLTGWLAWAGLLFTFTSITLGVGSLYLGFIQHIHPDMTVSVSATFETYQIVTLVCADFNCSSKMLPLITELSLWISIISFVTITIAIPAKATTHSSARFVFITGLTNLNWAFNGLDCATHMVEEVMHSEAMVPIATLGTGGIGFVTARLFSIAMMFNIGDLDRVASTATGTPILELFYQALGSNAGAIVLQPLIIVTGCGGLIASHTWQARLYRSFARDKGPPWCYEA